MVCASDPCTWEEAGGSQEYSQLLFFYYCMNPHMITLLKSKFAHCLKSVVTEKHSRALV